MNRSNLRIAAVVLALTGMSGCAAIQDSAVLQPDFWTIKASPQNNKAELGLAELAKGNNVEAQGHFESALKANPTDVHALYGLAVLYQNTGQPARARQLYDSILMLQPRPTEELLVWADKQTHPIVDLAGVNIHLLESGSTVAVPGAPMPSTSMGAAPQSAMAAPMPPMPMASVQPQPSFGGMAPAKPTQPQPLFADADLNIVARFQTLRSLLDQGLITQDEFLVRRKLNAGALLPMSYPSPASGLDRPVPAAEQISARLRAIGRALEMRALSPAQHTSERTMILDALMPATLTTRANPARPPKGLMEAADFVRRLEMLNAADLITTDEYAKERASIEGAMQPNVPKAASVSGGMPKNLADQDKSALSGFQPALHLASYRQKKAAERGWAALSKRFGAILGGLEHRIERVDLGGSKGVFYRLKAGPMPSNDAAKDACRKLKAARQYCDPSTINFG